MPVISKTPLNSLSLTKTDMFFGFKPWRVIEGNSCPAVIGKVIVMFTAYIINAVTLFIPAIVNHFAEKTKAIELKRRQVKVAPLIPLLRKFARLCKVQWLTGTTSLALPVIMRTGFHAHLKATGLLLREDALVPFCGELTMGIDYGHHGLNNHSLSGVSAGYYETAKGYGECTRKIDLRREIAVITDEVSRSLSNRVLIAALRIIHLSEDLEQRKLVMQKLQSLMPHTQPETYVELVNRSLEEDTYKPYCGERLPTGELVAVKRDDGTVRSAAILEEGKERFDIGKFQVLVETNGETRWVKKQDLFLLNDGVLEDEKRASKAAFDKKINHLIKLCCRPPLSRGFTFAEVEGLTDPYPVVFGTTKQQNYSFVKEGHRGKKPYMAVPGERSLKRSIPLGNGGIDFAFTTDENINRLKAALQKIKGITVLPYSALDVVFGEPKEKTGKFDSYALRWFNEQPYEWVMAHMETTPKNYHK